MRRYTSSNTVDDVAVPDTDPSPGAGHLLRRNHSRTERCPPEAEAGDHRHIPEGEGDLDRIHSSEPAAESSHALRSAVEVHPDQAHTRTSTDRDPEPGRCTQTETDRTDSSRS